MQDAKVCFVTLGRGFEAEACTGLLAGLMGGHAVQGDVEEEIGEVFRPGGRSKLIAAGEEESRLGRRIVEGANDGGDGGDEIGLERVVPRGIFVEGLFEIVDDLEDGPSSVVGLLGTWAF